MSRPTALLVLPLAILAAIAVSYCGDATPTAPDQEQSLPDQEQSLAADRASKHKLMQFTQNTDNSEKMTTAHQCPY